MYTLTASVRVLRGESIDQAVPTAASPVRSGAVTFIPDGMTTFLQDNQGDSVEFIRGHLTVPTKRGEGGFVCWVDKNSLEGRFN